MDPVAEADLKYRTLSQHIHTHMQTRCTRHSPALCSWIAREGLKAPLPEHWKPCKTNDTNEIFYCESLLPPPGHLRISQPS